MISSRRSFSALSFSSAARLSACRAASCCCLFLHPTRTFRKSPNTEHYFSGTHCCKKRAFSASVMNFIFSFCCFSCSACAASAAAFFCTAFSAFCAFSSAASWACFFRSSSLPSACTCRYQHSLLSKLEGSNQLVGQTDATLQTCVQLIDINPVLDN
jgi:hypothetical protein